MSHLKETENCILCGSKVPSVGHSRFYVRHDGSTKLSQVISELPTNLHRRLQIDWSLRQFCCRDCKILLEKRQKVSAKVAQIEADILNNRINVSKGTCSKKLSYDCDPAINTSTPKRTDVILQTTSHPVPPVSPIQPISSKRLCDRSCQTQTTFQSHEHGHEDLGCKIIVSWPSQQRQRKVHDMTEDNQNKDIHWVNHVKVSNRVSGNELPDDKPIKNCLSDLDNSKVAPSAIEHICQRANYVNLVSRECLGIIQENENTTEGMLETLKSMHSYVPRWTSKENITHFTDIGHVGDQVTVERSVNCLMAVSNGFTATERLEGIYFEIADWHADLKFLDV
ncbi:Hypothetical predicted protein [Paramuricea clavata]|uniref:Uncharacterized protein n=1 Tax=Paramuricea clavata TaxID=317549 RepID=A0A6S7K7R8_PARCT|nr:Hypothetical predicted protein [Paramuricea clavata]